MRDFMGWMGRGVSGMLRGRGNSMISRLCLVVAHDLAALAALPPRSPSNTPVRHGVPGDEHPCARDAPGGVLWWGSNASGALGDGSTAAQRSTPGPVPGLTGVAWIGAGGTSTCAAMATGSPVCWGANGFGQLGDGSSMNKSMPSATLGILGDVLPGAVSLAPSADHTCIIATGGAIECAGDDTNGALGNGGNVSVDTYVSSGVTNGGVAVTSS